MLTERSIVAAQHVGALRVEAQALTEDAREERDDERGEDGEHAEDVGPRESERRHGRIIATRIAPPAADRVVTFGIGGGEPLMSRIRRILHPSDFSRASGAAFTKAVELAAANRAELLVVHVLRLVMPMAGEGYVSPAMYQQIETTARDSAQKQLDALVAKAKQARVRAQSILVTGLPDAQINRLARSKRADLVVIGTHGRTGLAKFFLGSVASRVVSTARCPVLTVRGK